MQQRIITVQSGLKLCLWHHLGEGRPVLFLHGYLDTGRSFDEVVRLYGGHALCLDLRGHGQSARVGPGGSYHLLDHVKDVAEVLRQLGEDGMRPRAVVAHSMGGNIALILAGALPNAIDRLLLVDALGPPAEAPEEQASRIGRVLHSLGQKKPFKPAADLDHALARLRKLNPNLTPIGARRMLEHVMIPVDDGLAFPFDERLRGPTPVRYPESMWLALCKRVTAKVHVLRAEYGYVWPASPGSERLAAMGGTMNTVEGIGHHIHVDAPELVAAALCDLLGNGAR